MLGLLLYLGSRVGDFFDFYKKKIFKKPDLFDLNQIFLI